jgi:hypothetical protein
MGTLTSVDRCYCWTHGKHTVATRAHNSDGHSDISELLLLLDMWHTHGCCQGLQQRPALRHQRPVATVGNVAHTQLLLVPTAAMDTLTLGDHSYCWTCGTRTVTASAHNSDGNSDISRSLLLLDTIATSAYNSDGHSDISGPLLLLDTCVGSHKTLISCARMSS